MSIFFCFSCPILSLLSIEIELGKKNKKNIDLTNNAEALYEKVNNQFLLIKENLPVNI